MKVSEVIKKLEKCNPDYDVLITNIEESQEGHIDNINGEDFVYTTYTKLYSGGLKYTQIEHKEAKSSEKNVYKPCVVITFTELY